MKSAWWSTQNIKNSIPKYNALNKLIFEILPCSQCSSSCNAHSRTILSAARLHEVYGSKDITANLATFYLNSIQPSWINKSNSHALPRITLSIHKPHNSSSSNVRKFCVTWLHFNKDEAGRTIPGKYSLHPCGKLHQLLLRQQFLQGLPPTDWPASAHRLFTINDIRRETCHPTKFLRPSARRSGWPPGPCCYPAPSAGSRPLHMAWDRQHPPTGPIHRQPAFTPA